MSEAQPVKATLAVPQAVILVLASLTGEPQATPINSASFAVLRFSIQMALVQLLGLPGESPVVPPFAGFTAQLACSMGSSLVVFKNWYELPLPLPVK